MEIFYLQHIEISSYLYCKFWLSQYIYGDFGYYKKNWVIQKQQDDCH